MTPSPVAPRRAARGRGPAGGAASARCPGGFVHGRVSMDRGRRRKPRTSRCPWTDCAAGRMRPPETGLPVLPRTGSPVRMPGARSHPGMEPPYRLAIGGNVKRTGRSVHDLMRGCVPNDPHPPSPARPRLPAVRGLTGRAVFALMKPCSPRLLRSCMKRAFPARRSMPSASAPALARPPSITTGPPGPRWPPRRWPRTCGAGCGFRIPTIRART
jgi:hypothetical protein